MKFDTLLGNWVSVGPASFSVGGAYGLTFALNSGIPYVAYANSNNSYKANVMKFDALSGNWVMPGRFFQRWGVEDVCGF